jgi:hypothetical protein
MFYNFVATPTFDEKGTFVIDVSADVDNFDGVFYLYRYENGKLLKMNAKYDADAQTVTYTTDKLGAFFITNKEIPHGILIKFQDSTSGTTTQEQNPSTGAGSLPTIMVLSIAGAIGTIVTLKKIRR